MISVQHSKTRITALAITALVVVLAGTAGAQQQQRGPRGHDLPREELEKRFKEKFELPFVQKVPWVWKIDEAKQQSAQLAKPVVAYFTRSHSG